jgi:hypothetical protein
MKLENLLELHSAAVVIVESKLPWKEKYHKIFSEEISDKVLEQVSLAFDEDSSYKNDVESFMKAFDLRVSELLRSVE